MAILFRTHIQGSHLLGASKQYSKQYGSIWSDIREYQIGDSVRDIFWKKIGTNHEVYTKTREDESAFRLITIFSEYTGGDYFQIGDEPSRSTYQGRCGEIIEHSARQQHIPHETYTAMSMRETLDLLVQKRTRNTLILVFVTDIDESLLKQGKKLSRENDVIVFRIFHPFEFSPHDGISFLGKILHTKDITSYQHELRNIREKWKKDLQKHHISYSELLTHQDIEKHINFYFKHRYEYSSLAHYPA